MPTITVDRVWDVAFRVGERYGFERQGEHFDGVICGVWPTDATHVAITLEISPAEHRRMLSAVNA